MEHIHKNYLRCKTCAKLFPDLNDLETHKRSHKEDDTKCSCCGKIYLSTKSLHRHKKLYHGEHFVCENCKRTFSDNEKLIAHRKSHENELSCKFCEKEFTSVTLQRIHVKNKNCSKCKKCKKIFSDKETLRNGTKQTHETMKFNKSECIFYLL